MCLCLKVDRCEGRLVVVVGSSEALHKTGESSPASLSLLAYGPVWRFPAAADVL